MAFLNVTVRDWGQEGKCDRDQPFHTGAPGPLGRVLTHLVCGDAEASGKYEVLKIYAAVYTRM